MCCRGAADAGGADSRASSDSGPPSKPPSGAVLLEGRAAIGAGLPEALAATWPGACCARARSPQLSAHEHACNAKQPRQGGGDSFMA